MIDWKGIHWKFEEDDMMFLKVAPWKAVIRFKNKGKLNLRHFGPFRILKKIGPIAYRLKLPSELSRIHNIFHVPMLKKYVPDPSQNWAGTTSKLSTQATRRNLWKSIPTTVAPGMDFRRFLLKSLIARIIIFMTLLTHITIVLWC